MKNLTWQNPEQLFVAQELINKVKSKCCGIKVIEKLWPDNSGNDERMHKAIGRLRSFLRKIDPSLSIINKNGTYRLIISEKSLVKRNS